MRIMLSIGQLNHKCGPSVQGVRLAGQLAGMGHEVFLVHTTPEGEAEAALLREFADVLIALSPRHPLHPIRGIEFARHARSVKPDVVEFRLPTDMYNLSHAARRSGVRTLYMAGNVLQYNAGWMQRTLPWLCNHSIDFLGGVSHDVIRSFVDAGYRGRTGRIPLGVEWPDDQQLASERARMRSQLDCADDETVFCTVGRLAPDKQQINLLRACRELHARGKEFRFVVVGDGPARPQLEAYCDEAGLTKAVHFAGWQTDVFPFLAAADAFVFHSTDTAEGLPAVNLEAAAVRLPLILADLKGLRELWADGDQVLFAPVGEPRAFADRMQELIDSPDRRKALGQAVAEKVRAEHSCEAMARVYLEVFEEITA